MQWLKIGRKQGVAYEIFRHSRKAGHARHAKQFTVTCKVTFASDVPPGPLAFKSLLCRLSWQTAA